MSSADWSAAAVLTPVEVDVCWELLGLGETPPQLELPSPGRTRQERADIVACTVDALRGRGLADTGGPCPELASLLGTLAGPAWSVDTRMRLDRLVAGIGAVGPAGAVLAARQGEDVWLMGVPEHAVLPTLVELAGPIGRGAGQAVNVATAVFDAARATAGEDLWRLADELTARGQPGAEARALARMCSNADWRGQFGAMARDRTGTPRRTDRVLGFHRTSSGWYLQVRRGGFLTLTPATRERMLAQLQALLDEVR